MGTFAFGSDHAQLHRARAELLLHFSDDTFPGQWMNAFVGVYPTCVLIIFFCAANCLSRLLPINSSGHFRGEHDPIFMTSGYQPVSPDVHFLLTL
jgi:hypothetical protein